MKKSIYVVFGIIVLILAGISVYTLTSANRYPQIAYIEDETYYGTGEICETVPRRMPDGPIETFVPAAVMPDSYNSANFGSKYKALEYMFLEDGKVIIHIGSNWYYFTKA